VKDDLDGLTLQFDTIVDDIQLYSVLNECLKDQTIRSYGAASKRPPPTATTTAASPVICHTAAGSAAILDSAASTSMGQACCSLCCRSKHGRIAPLPIPSGTAAAAATGAPTLLQTLTAATRATAKHSGHKLSADQAAAVLDSLLTALLREAGLEPACSDPPHSIKQLVDHLQSSCLCAGCSTEKLAEAVAAASTLLLQQWQSSRASRSVAQPLVPAADRLVAWLHTLLYEQVTLESAASLQRKHAAAGSLCGLLGWQTSTLAACLGPTNKALLLLLLQAQRHGSFGQGEAKLQVVVRRKHAFWDGLQEACRQGLVPTLPSQQQQAQVLQNTSSAAGAPITKLFPRFVSAAAGDQHSIGHNLLIEAGEGHGPRKEFFELAAADFAQAQPASSLDGTSLKQEGSSTMGPLFVQLRFSGVLWFNTQLVSTDASAQAYFFAGWLIAQAIPNRAVLGVPLSPVLFDKLLDGKEFKVCQCEKHPRRWAAACPVCLSEKMNSTALNLNSL